MATWNACRLHLYCCIHDNTCQAVQLLRKMPQLTSISLGVHCCHGSELDELAPDTIYPDVDEWDYSLRLPPLAGITGLTKLYMAGNADLPPDLHQLAHLCSLTIDMERSCAEPFEWASEPLTAMTSLTRVELSEEWSEGLVLPGEGEADQCVGACFRAATCYLELGVQKPPRVAATLLQTLLCWHQHPALPRCMLLETMRDMMIWRRGGSSWRRCALTCASRQPDRSLPARTRTHSQPRAF